MNGKLRIHLFRRGVLCLFTLAWVFATGMAFLFAGEEDETLYKEGKKAFRSCAACHCVNEPNLKEDEDWLQLNWVTRCIDAGEDTPRVRKALDVFFRSPKTLRPLLVDENYTPREGRVCGKIKVPPTSGSAYLKAERESIRKGCPPKVRIYWNSSDTGKTLTVPAGKYRVINYRFYRTTKEDGKESLWTLSAANMNGCAEVTVPEGGETTFDLKAELCCNLTAERTDEGQHFALAIRDESDSTLTLSRDGKMWLPQFVVKSADGKEIYRAEFENT